MQDQIHIRDLHLRTILGINDEERKNRQDVILNLTLFTETRTAGESDDIADTINYRTLTKRVIEMVETSDFFLVERMAEEVAKLCLSEKRVDKVRVQVDKPMALRFARTVGLTIERRRDED